MPKAAHQSSQPLVAPSFEHRVNAPDGAALARAPEAIQRFTLMAAIVLLALLGLLGPAALARSQQQELLESERRLAARSDRRPAAQKCEVAIEKCERVKLKCGSGAGSDAERRAKLATSRLGEAQRAVQALSDDALVREFGPPPSSGRRRVEMALSARALGGERNVLQFEMAPDDEMPATVLYFLRQVAAGLWDGAAFHRNAGHVLQAGPMRKRAQFEAAAKARGVPLSVPFQEYSPRVPHQKYTLGLAGRPGGPDFYVSLVDNTLNHGPGTQSEEAKLLQVWNRREAERMQICLGPVTTLYAPPNHHVTTA